jgi:hypothetical protein
MAIDLMTSLRPGQKPLQVTMPQFILLVQNRFFSHGPAISKAGGSPKVSLLCVMRSSFE